MQWSQFRVFLESGNHIFVHQLTFGEKFTAMDDPMTDCAYLFQIFNATMFGTGKYTQNILNSNFMVQNLPFKHDLLTVFFLMF